MKKNKINLEKMFKKLEGILDKLESSEIDIDEMVQLYEKGMKLTQECKQTIEKAEQKIKVINENNDD